jgi:hypothetical protein
MKKKPQAFESYPLWILIITNVLNLAVCVAGSYIMFRLSLITGFLFIAYLVVLEFYLYREACPHCFYYGRLCAFGRGVLAALFFKRGDPKKFCERELSYKDFIPQLLVVLVPLTVGIALLVSRGFDILVLIAMTYPIFSWFALNPLIYGRLACKHCRQGSICCPALDFFIKKRKK